MSMFGNNRKGPAGIGKLVTAINSEVNQRGATMVPQVLATRVIGMESMAQTEINELTSQIRGLGTALEQAASDAGLKLSHSQLMAGQAAAVITGDIKAALHSPVERPMPAMEGFQFISAAGTGAMSRSKKALEAYDEKENRTMAAYSIAYNLQAARQDEFGEAFFPTVTVTPDQFGFTVSIQLLQVMDEVRRSISGEASKNFGKRNILQAFIEPEILRNDQTKVVPVYRDESKQFFVDPTLVAPVAVEHEGESVTTAPLAMGKQFSLIAIGQTDALLETGILDSTDALDSYMQLQSLYVKLPVAAGGAEVLKFDNLNQFQTSVFTPVFQGNYRAMQLAAEYGQLVIKPSTKLVDGAASALLKTYQDRNLTIRIGLGVYGIVNQELGDIRLTASKITVTEVRTQDGVKLDLTTGDGAAIVALFESADAFGYDVNARRTNSNRRERGQLLDLTSISMVYGVPLLAPITIPRPLTAGDQNDASDLAALITTTHLRTSNAAVAKLLETEKAMEAYITKNGGVLEADPEIFGLCRLLVNPFFERQKFDASKVVASLDSHDNIENVQAALVNVLRDMAYRMYRDSNYKSVADAMAGGQAAAPTVIIGTDPVTAKYINITGDFRTLGGTFNVKIVTTMNKYMKDKIIMTFGEFGEGKEGVPNPMHFGNMAWKPELTLVLPIHRNGGNSKELTVQPSFLHVVNLPIMASVDVSGLSETVTSKIPVLFQNK